MRAQIAVMFVAAVLAAVVATVAVADHRHTRHRLDRAQLFSWYCEHRQRFCTKTKPGPIHERWEIREYAYEAVEGLVLVAFAGAGIWFLRSRRTR